MTIHVPSKKYNSLYLLIILFNKEISSKFFSLLYQELKELYKTKKVIIITKTKSGDNCSNKNIGINVKKDIKDKIRDVLYLNKANNRKDRRITGYSLYKI